MFKAARWRSEKNKIKAVFKLQFHATQASKSNTEGLTISVVPGDVGKPTVKLEKAVVREGCCRWENPVYEPVKFVKEPKSGKINQKIYHFVVSTGAAKGGLIGEASIDFANYFETIKAFTLSLPLKNSSSKAVLHVTIQRVQENADQREVEENEDVSSRSRGRSLEAYFSKGDEVESITNGVLEDGAFDETNHNAELSLNRGVSSASDITVSSSDCSSGLDTPVENVRKLEHRKFQWEWLAGSDHKSSTDTSEDASPGERRSEHDSDNEIEKLKAELVALTRQVDVSEMELQTLRKQIAKESKKGQDLSQEVVSLKVECEKLKSFQKRMDDAKAKDRLQVECRDPFVILEEIRQELSYEKDLNANLRLQLQKTQESNAELILAVQDLEQMLNEKESEISVKENAEEITVSRSDMDEDEEQKALEELVKGDRDPEETILDLRNEIEICRREKDELEMQMEQLALDYEILKQENHDMSYRLEQNELQDQLKMQCECSSSINELENQIVSLETELKIQSKDSLATIKELETCIKSLEEELEAQAQVFESDLESITRAKVEQEQRAVRAEEALKVTKSKNANTAERLQEEFKRLSVQVASTFDANEKVAKNALNEASELRVQKTQLEELLKKAHKEIQEYEVNIVERNELVTTIALLKKEIAKLSDESQRMKQSLSQDEDEKEKLRKQILELKKKEETLTTMEKKLKESNGKAKPASKNHKGAAAPSVSKEVTSLKEKIKLLEIKKKETALEASTNTLLEKEIDLQKKIDGLGTKTQELKVAKDGTEVVSNVDPPQEIVTLAECLSSLKRNGAILSKEVAKASSLYNSDNNHSEVLAEFGFLKERNRSLERELNEMQERYSEISLKFAEGEGERQQLVMTVRNLKNGSKS